MGMVMNRLIFSFYCFPLVVFFLLMASGVAKAVDASTHSFANCNFLGTGQAVSYTATFGEDHDYQSSAHKPRYTVYNPVGISSVTVDNLTGLMWITNPTTDAAMGGVYTWVNALTACEGKTYAGYSDWRLPNVRELQSLVDYSASAAPLINTAAFPATISGDYWTSTTYPSDTAMHYIVGFADGRGYYYAVSTNYVRCVRGGPPQ